MANKLLKKNRKVAKAFQILDGETPVEAVLIKPTTGDRIRVLTAAKAAGEYSDDKDAKIPLEKQAAFVGRIGAALIRDPRTLNPLFTETEAVELLDEDWFDEMQAEILAVFSGNKEATSGN